MSLKENIEKAFVHRMRPELDIGYVAYDDSERRELELFHAKDWQNITSKDLECCYDVFYHFSSHAFAYYFAALMMISYIEKRPDLLAVDLIVSELDRSPNIDYWSDEFLEKWSSFTTAEYDAIEGWLYWLFLDSGEEFTYDNTSERCIKTVELLKNHKSLRS